MLNKADLLRGSNTYTDFFIEAWNGNVKIRPLTEGENLVVETIKSKGIKTQMVLKEGARPSSIELDAGVVNASTFNANIKTCEIALKVGEDSFTAEELKQLKPVGIVAKIAAEIHRISGTTPEADEFLKTFRNDEVGA